MTTNRMNELARRAWGEIRCGHDPIRAILNAMADHANGCERMEWASRSEVERRALRMIECHGGLSGRMLGHVLGINPTNGQATALRLERDGFVVRQGSGRRSVYVLTKRRYMRHPGSHSPGRPRMQGKETRSHADTCRGRVRHEVA